MADKDPCALVKGAGHRYCEKGIHPDSRPGLGGEGGGITDSASDHVKELADSLLTTLRHLVAPKKSWAPARADSWVYEQFMWLGQHLAVAIFVCVVVVCALTAWQGTPRMRQMGASTGWTLAAVAGMASVPGIVVLLNQAVSAAFTAAFASNEATLFSVIKKDLDHGTAYWHPLAVLLIVAVLVVALAFAALVFLTRQLGILAFVCMAPLVLASLARGGDTSAVKTWAQRLLGLMFAPLVLLLISPFVDLVKGSLVEEAVLLVAADVLMLRMIFHGVPYFGPRVARAARTVVERSVNHPLAHSLARAGAPDYHEQGNAPRGPRIVATPGRAIHQDRGILFAAYGVQQRDRDAARPQPPGTQRREPQTTPQRKPSQPQARPPRPDTP
ncbi:hypothetical protein ACFV19_33465 [Streptomyces griseoluteus]|uniref:hypothetical protein n=1 Tax=Streptomyces griseoluteus TaxID=29306 RepID=UPI00368A2027